MTTPVSPMMRVQRIPKGYVKDLSSPFLRTLRTMTRCPYCTSTNIVGHGSGTLSVRDVPVDGKPTVWMIERRRGRCMSCSTTFSESLPGVAEKRLMTAGLVAWIIKQARKRAFVAVAADVGVTEGSVRGVFKAFLDGLDAPSRAEQVRLRKSMTKAYAVKRT